MFCRGPYILLGYSAGGNTAFETVKEMENRGLEVSDLIIVDAYQKKQALPPQPSSTSAEHVPAHLRECIDNNEIADLQTSVFHFFDSLKCRVASR